MPQVLLVVSNGGAGGNDINGGTCGNGGNGGSLKPYTALLNPKCTRTVSAASK
jgi:hypothetical protein